jgi:hypothetical protein
MKSICSQKQYQILTTEEEEEEEEDCEFHTCASDSIFQKK